MRGSYRGNASGNFVYSSTGYLPEAQTLFQAMDVKPTTARKRLINYVITRLIASGNWDNLDSIWFTAAHDKQAAKLNWKNPSSYTLSDVNTPTFAIDNGFSFNGTNQYIDTGFNPNTNGVNYTLNSASFGVWTNSSVQNSVQYDMGALSGSDRCLINSWSGGANIYTYINQTAFQNAAIADSRGLTALKRISSTQFEVYRNPTLLVTTTQASSAKPNLNLYIGAENSGSAANFSTRNNLFGFVGGNVNVPLLYDIVYYYLNQVGSI